MNGNIKYTFYDAVSDRSYQYMEMGLLLNFVILFYILRFTDLALDFCQFAGNGDWLCEAKILSLIAWAGALFGYYRAHNNTRGILPCKQDWIRLKISPFKKIKVYDFGKGEYVFRAFPAWIVWLTIIGVSSFAVISILDILIAPWVKSDPLVSRWTPSVYRLYMSMLSPSYFLIFIRILFAYIKEK